MDQNLRLSSFVLLVVGFIDSLYLSWVKLAHTEVFCGGSSNCATVNNSKYAEFYGIPIAFLGLGAYAVMLIILYLENRGGFWKEYGPILLFGLSMVGTLYSFYLTYIEIAVLRAICPYCVVSAVVLTLMFIVSILRLAKSQK